METPSERFSNLVNLFAANSHIPYVILSNWKALGCKTVNVLVNDKAEFIKAFKLRKDRSAPEPYRSFYSKRIGIKPFQFEVRGVKDNFYPVNLFNRILKGRMRDEDLDIYIVHPRDEFLSLLYPQVYYRNYLSLDDQVRINEIRPVDFTISLGDALAGHNYLCSKDFFPVQPVDQSLEYYVP